MFLEQDVQKADIFKVTFAVGWVYFWIVSVENTLQDVVYRNFLSSVAQCQVKNNEYSLWDYVQVKGPVVQFGDLFAPCFPTIVCSFSSFQWSPDVFTKARAVAAL